jgi:putative flippase GtrA
MNLKAAMVLDHTFFRFILVGVINTIAGSVIMFGLYNVAEFNYWLSSACNYTVIIPLSFFLNKYFTFRIQHLSVCMIAKFILTIAVSYFIAYSISKPVVNYFLRNSQKIVRENIALFAGMCVFTILNYIGQRFIVFN